MMYLGVNLDGAGAHPAAWREADARADRLFTADHIVALATLAERGLLDFVTLSDSFDLEAAGPGEVRGSIDALLALARVAPATTTIGLVPTVTTTHTEPFHVSKNLATLDFVSLGRAGWLVDVSPSPEAARHFGRRQVVGEEDLYLEAAEAIDVAGRLWDSWEDDAVIRDVPTGRYLERQKVHYVDFEGRFFSVRGPSITPRSPQGQLPVFVDARNDHALTLAVAHADVVLVHAATIDEAQATRAFIRERSGAAVLATIDVLVGSNAEEARAERARLDARAPARPGALDFVGSSAELADLLASWNEAGAVDGFLIRPATLPRTLTQFVDEVVPLLQHRGVFHSETERGVTLRKRFGLDRPANRYADAGGRT